MIVGVVVIQWGNGYSNEFEITPGHSEAVDPLLSVRDLSQNPHPGQSILLTDVYLTQLTNWQTIISPCHSQCQVVSENELETTGVPSSELIDQGYVDMTQSKQFAEAAALTALGWRIPTKPSGALLYDVYSNSPAIAAGLGVGDQVVSVNHQPIASSCGLIDALYPIAPGSEVALGVHRASYNAAGTITWGPLHTVMVRTQAPPKGDQSFGCPGRPGVGRSVIGIYPYDDFAFTFPGQISIATPMIGGPSAGLAMTLALINRLSATSITGTAVVAATGTIEPGGAVGDVGGVAEKTVAVERAGATVFIVPQVEVATATHASDGHLRIFGVTSLRQALTDLESIGGAAPRPLTAPYPLKAPS